MNGGSILTTHIGIVPTNGYGEHIDNKKGNQSMVTRHKTDRMLLLETRNGGTRIQDLMINAIKANRGEFQTAASSLGIPKGTFSRWLLMLGIEIEAQNLRKHFGLGSTTSFREVRRLRSRTSGGYTILDRIQDTCIHPKCKAYVENLSRPLTIESIRKKNKSDTTAKVVVIDGRKTKHEFIAFDE